MNLRQLPIATQADTRRYLVTILGRHRFQFSITLLLSVAAALTAMITPFMVGFMTDAFATWAQGDGGDPGADLNAQVGIILASVLLQASLAWGAFRNLAALNEEIAADIREEFMQRTLALPPAQIEAAGTGELLSRNNLDVGQVQMAIIHAAPQFFVGLVTVLIYLAGAFWASPLLGAAALVAVPLLALVLRWYFRRATPAFHAVQGERSDMTTTVVETIDGVRTVEAFGWQRRRVDLFTRAANRLLSAQNETIRLRRVLIPMLDFSAFLPCLTVLLVGGALTASGHLSLSATTTVVLLMQLAVAPATEMILSLELMQVGNVSLARLVGVQVEEERRGSARPEPDADEVVELKGVDFSYTDGRPVLQGVDLALRRGERLALVGPTGAGKSTLAKILVGVHRPDRGVALVGGVDVSQVDEDSLRGYIVLVTQEFHLFNDTLASNLRLGAPEADDAALIEALQAVDAGALLAQLKDGLETRVGGRDHKLTPAEVQQVALARVILAGPEVIVLDEATSMMSAGAASDIEQGLNRVLAGKTVVSIAHRLNTAHDADRVAVVERGRITELGSHDELLARGGSYAALWSRWHS